MIPYELNRIIAQRDFDLGFTLAHWIFPTYTLMMIVAVSVGLFLLVRKSDKDKIPRAVQIKMLLLCTWATMVGGRLFYLIFYDAPEQRWRILLEMFAIWKVGSVSVGGFIFLISALYLVCRRYRLRFIRVLDNIAPSLAIGLFFARMGCFFAGCCYGTPTKVSWGIARFGAAIHPTQIYSSIYNLFIFIIVYWISTVKHRDGTVFAWYLILYGISRFLVEFVRINPKVLFSLTIAQLVSITMVFVGCALLWSKPSKGPDQKEGGDRK